MEFERKCEIVRAIGAYVIRRKRGTSCSLGEIVECRKSIPEILPLVSAETGIPERELMENWFEEFYKPSGTLQ
jgi:hypothetical protein